jgi:CHASE3 domain sensor protein
MTGSGGTRAASRWRAASGLPLGSNIPVPVGFQVLVGVGSLMVLFVASILLAIFLVIELTDDNRHLSTHQVPYATAIEEAALAAKGAANDSRGFLISGNELYIEEFARRVGEARTAFSLAFRHATTTDELSRIAESRARFEQWVRAARGEFGRFVSGHPGAAVAASLGADRALRKRYETSLTRTSELAREAIRAGETSYGDASRRAVVILLVCLLATLALGLAVTIWLVRKILKPVYAVLRLFHTLQAPSMEGVQASPLGDGL